MNSKSALFLPFVFIFCALHLGAQVAPGGVSNGLSLWNKADGGAVFSGPGVTPATDGTNVQQWNNEPGLGAYNFSQATAGKRPFFYNTNSAKLFNFNPLIEFDPTGANGNGDKLGFSTTGTNLFGTDQLTVFMAQRLRSTDFTQVWFKWQTDPTAGTRVGFENAGANLRFDVAGSNNIGNPTAVPIGGIHRAVMSVWANTSARTTVYGAGQAAGSRVRIDGKEGTTVAATAATDFTSSQELSIGANNNLEDTYYSNLDISEVIIYKRGLVAAERDRVDTYLGLKYGLSLYHNYVATDGTVAWNYAANAAYNFGIIGIARDDQTALFQKQSKSMSRLNDAIAVSDILTLYLNNKAVNNQSNTGTFTAGDKSFLITGCNRDVLSSKSTENPPLIYATLAREWFSQQLNFTNSEVSLEFDFSTVTLGPLNTDSLFFLMDDNGNFSNATVLNAAQAGMTINGNLVTIKLSASKLQNKPYFTFGKTTCAKINFSTGNFPPTCPGASDGKAFAAATSGGRSPYTFALGAGAFAANDTFPNLAPNIYKLYVKDANGCMDSANTTITAKPDLNLNLNKTDVKCFGDANGSITASGSGGTPAYQFANGTGAFGTGTTFSNLSANTYKIYIKDANGCLDSANSTVTEPTLLVLDSVVTSATCPEVADGKIVASGMGGKSPYQFRIGTGSFGASGTFNNLDSGLYTITIRDANLCSQSLVVNLLAGPSIVVSTNQDTSICDGTNITLKGQGATTYTWNNGVSDNVAFKPSATLTYKVIGTTPKGCRDSALVTVTLIPLANPSISPVAALCSNDANVQLTAASTGGYWRGTGVIDTANGTFSPSSAGAGNHRIIYEIKGTCSVDDTVFVLVNQRKDATINPAGPYCENAGIQQLSTIQSGGTWQGSGVNSTGQFDPMLAGIGNHQIIYTLGGTCPDADTIQILVNSTFDATIIAGGPYCVDASPVQLNSITPGATWSGQGIVDAAIGLFDPKLAGVGTHAITHSISGTCGTTDTESFTVLPLDTARIIATPTLCHNAQPYQLTADKPNGTWTGSNVNSSGLFTITSPGQFKVYYTHSLTCAYTDSFTVNVSNPIGINLPNGSVLCNGNTNGILSATASGGTPNYTYSWTDNTSLNSASRTGLSAGNYTLTVTDVNGCTAQANAMISQPNAINFSSTFTIVNDSCFNACKGAVFAPATGGTPSANGYSYSTIPNAGVPNNTGVRQLCAGTYTLRTSDANGCSKDSIINITQPQALSVSTVSTPESCGKNNGTANAVSALGGTPGYTYSWTKQIGGNIYSGASISNLAYGNYILSIRDALGCAATSTILVDTVARPLASINTLAVSCNGGSDGSGVAVASQGRSPYTYLWNSGETSIGINNKPAGTTNVRITDADGCIANASANITQPSVVNLPPINDQVLCFGVSYTQSLNASGGNTGAYTYRLNGSNLSGDQLSLNTANSYSLVAIDSKGCLSNIVNFTINLNPAISANINPLSDTICKGNSSLFNATASGGNGIYTYAWNNGNTGNISTYQSSEQSPDSIGVFVVVADGCSQNDTAYANIYFYPLPAIEVQITNPAGCVPHTASYALLNTNLSNVVWQLGDGATEYSYSTFSHTFNDAGIYSHNITATSVNGCNLNLNLPNAVNAFALPVADFGFNPEKPTMLNTQVSFFDFSLGNIAEWEWHIYTNTDTLHNSDKQSFGYNFPPEALNYLVSLKVNSTEGCTDSTVKDLLIGREWALYVPNSFSPNNDGYNDLFTIEHTGLSTDEFSIELFNRWGELIFSSNRLDFKWTGTYKGIDLKEDVYTWKIKARVEGTAVKIAEFGQLNLLK